MKKKNAFWHNGIRQSPPTYTRIIHNTDVRVYLCVAYAGKQV